ncbi:ribonuclease Z [Endozoicomonas sp. Mp262]|uniref:ribonuclease Z n=1 Tax=Endozoicomonas sp. Mp262 TaxID=2919499 RepID=UPI0021D92E79
MRLTFLGTSAGMPTTERNVTALALAIDDSRCWYLVDCGEGTQHRLLTCRYTLAQLKAIFITHIHGDHIFGLPGLLTSASMQGRIEPLTICGPDGVEPFVRQSLACADVHDLPFELHFVRSDAEDFTFSDENFAVTAHPLSHRVPSFAYRFFEKTVATALDGEKLKALGVPRGPLWGQLQKGERIVLENGTRVSPEQVMDPAPRSRVAVIGGDNDQPELLHEVLLDADLLVHESTFTDEVFQKVGPRWMHSTAKKVAEAAARAGVPNIILTHFSGRYRLSPRAGENSVEMLRREAQEYYQGQVELAEDLGVWQLSREGQLVGLND